MFWIARASPCPGTLAGIAATEAGWPGMVIGCMETGGWVGVGKPVAPSIQIRSMEG